MQKEQSSAVRALLSGIFSTSTRDGSMDEHRTDADAERINDEMVKRMELRRQAQPERRQRPSAPPEGGAQRRICGFCFQPGDHRTADQCRRALEGGG